METDLLGEAYERRTIDLGRDSEGPLTATLVRRRSENPTGAAVLYLHGFVDYFFQTHLADFYTGRGIDFYALDLRRHGRSLQPYQTPNYCLELTEYYPEIDEAVQIIRQEDNRTRLLVNGHSTGGLIVAVWAADRRDAGVVDALFLNSPWVDLNASWVERKVLVPIATTIGRVVPKLKVKGLNEVYGSSIHKQYRGEWEYDLSWKPLNGFPVYAGWLRGIVQAQARVQRGLGLTIPVLVACSNAAYKRAQWAEAARSADAVLDPAHMVRYAPGLSSNTTLVRIDGGLHDLTLSPPPVREKLFEGLGGWLTENFE